MLFISWENYPGEGTMEKVATKEKLMGETDAGEAKYELLDDGVEP